jgi:hypothetical protein
MALELSDSITITDPKQAVLLMVGAIDQLPRRDYIVSDVPERLLEKIDSMLKPVDVAVKAA